MRAHDNRFLAQVDANVYAELLPHSSVVRFTSGEILTEARDEIDKVYFPHNLIISCVVALTGGGVIDTAMIGRDGVFGAALALDGRRAFNGAVVQVGGEATVIDARIFPELIQRYPGFRRQLLGYEQFHLADIQQTAACNAVHTVLSRTSRWLLRMHDLVGKEIAITQEELSQMIGVRRTSITAAVKVLQDKNAITLSRGHVRIVDLKKVAADACECHASVARSYRSLQREE